MRIIAVAAILTVYAIGAAAQQTPPQEVYVSDLIQGYVPAGTIVVTTGHLAYVDERALLNPSLPSAMWPAVVDIARLPSAKRDKVQAQCAAVKITAGGCQVKVQGQVQQIDGRSGLAATEIEIVAVVH